MNPKTLALIVLAVGVISFLFSFSGGPPTDMRGETAIAGAILMSGSIVALAILSKRH